MNRSRRIQWVSLLAALAVVVTLAVVYPGFTAQEVASESESVWVTRQSGEYARVNTQTAEIDTVRQVESPSGVVNAGDEGVLFAQGMSRAWLLDPAQPADLRLADETDSGADTAVPEQLAQSTPEGTQTIIAAAGRVLFVTDAGEALLVDADSDDLSATTRLDPFSGDPVTTVASTHDGTALVFSASSGQLRWLNLTTGAFTSRVFAVTGWLEHRESAMAESDNTNDLSGVQVSIIGDDWVLYDSTTNTVWRDSLAPVQIDVQGKALLQSSTQQTALQDDSLGVHAETVLIADEGGVWQVDANEAVRLIGAIGVPAQPTVDASRDAQPAAAWMSPSGVMLWTGGDTVADLVLDPSIEALADPLPVLQSNGDHAVLIDERSGMMWTIPDGRLIPLSQWSLSDTPQQEISDTVSQEATEPEPPTAVSDSFGVRAGATVVLPVLLNDYDPNSRDVLTIITEGVGDEVPADFGTVSPTPYAQSLQIHTPAGATGTAQFQYRVTDGVHTSDPATVTLEVVPEEINSAPEWCGVTDCQRSVPSAEIVPGGTLRLPVLEGWVDPQGDPLLLVAAETLNAEASVQSFVTETGELALRHSDPNAPATDLKTLVSVADSTGATAQLEITVRVRPGAAPVNAATAVTVTVGQTLEFNPMSSVTGGSGSFELLTATIDQGNAQATAYPNTQTVGVKASEAGESTLVVSIRDRITEHEFQGEVRVTAVETPLALTVPALRAFVRAQSDTTVDVVAALPAADARGIVLDSAFVREGAVQAEVVANAQLRVASVGSAATRDDSQQASFAKLGTVEVVARSVSTEQFAPGQVTVYEVPESDAGGVIAVADTITVRAGSLTEIPVLHNDIAAPAEQLVLHPEIRGSGAEGELAFASGSQLRYLAPSTPGEYTLGYTVSGFTSPEQSHSAQVRVTVTGAEGNRAPQPPTISARVEGGSQTQVLVPFSGVDPDGDRVRLVSVSNAGAEQLTATMSSSGDRIEVAASEMVRLGIQELRYTVRDTAGADGTGVLRVIVADTQSDRGSPIAYADEVRVAVGSKHPVAISPTSNDVDPAHGALELVSVVPNLPGGSAHPEYDAQLKRLDTSSMAEGVVRIVAGDTLGSSSFVYTVRSTASTGTATGVINVLVSARVGSSAPQISDTVLTVGQREELLTTGVNVLRDRVIWPGGDTNGLEIAIWGDASDSYQAEGPRITGPYREAGETVPFLVRGVDAQGEEIESFGFLFIPPIDELRITKLTQAPAVTVEEEATVTVALRQALSVGARDTVQVAAEQFPVHRQQASCAGTNASNGAMMTYQAGREAPWSDQCTVQVKLAEQTTYSTVAIPVTVVPDEPTVQLSAVTRTIAPGATETIDLVDMLSWYGNRAGKAAALNWSFDTSAEGFEIARAGTRLTVTPLATTAPGTQHAIAVTVTGAGTAQAMLKIRVGVAASGAPKGATIGLRCTVGETCGVDVTGQAGEYDPFAGSPGGGLTLSAVDGSACSVASFSMSGNRVQVAWPDNRGPGGLCTVSFTVRDAQQRSGTGSVEFDAQGIPQPPASVTQNGYTADSVRLLVMTGAAAEAYPALTGMVIEQDGARANANCAPSNGGFLCTVNGLEAGQKHRFSARAVNSVGESDATANTVTAWAYRTPVAPEVSVSQVSAESTSLASVEVQTQTSDRTTGGYRVTVGGISQVFGVNDRIQLSGIPVGQVNWDVVPLSDLAVPPGDTADGARASGALTVGGQPILNLQLDTDNGSEIVRATVSIDHNGASGTRYGVSSGTDPNSLQCTATENGDRATVELRGVRNRTLHVKACAENEWGAAPTLTQTILVGGELTAPTVNSGFTVSPEPTISASGSYEYLLLHAPEVTAATGARLEYRVNGVSVGETFPTTLSSDNRSTVQVRQTGGDSVSPWAEITGNVPSTVRITPPTCVPAGATSDQLRDMISAAARTAATIEHTAGQLHVSWSGDYAALLPLTITVGSCDPPPPMGP